MLVSFSEPFKKTYRKKIQKGGLSESDFKDALGLFIANPFDERLKTHRLSGKLKGLWSFSVTYSIRVVFYFTNDKPEQAVFVNIGDHDQVY